jgi:hypothetical protein
VLGLCPSTETAAAAVVPADGFSLSGFLSFSVAICSSSIFFNSSSVKSLKEKYEITKIILIVKVDNLST